MNKPKRILIFELNWLGDILFSFPFLRAVRNAFPDAFISCAVVPRYRELLLNNPWINDIQVLSDRNTILSVGEKLRFIRAIREQGYDTCFLLKPSRIKAAMAMMAGIPERIGFAGKNAPLTKEIEMPDRSTHRADHILKLAEAIGVTDADGMYEYFIGKEDEKRVNTLLRGEGRGTWRMVAINPGGNWPPKRWPAGNFVELAKRLLNRFSDVEMVVTGAVKDIGLGGNIVSEVGPDRCYSVAGRTGLNDLAALFKRCTLVISADSGPLHLASAVGAATVGLFGPTSHKVTGPRGKGDNITIFKDNDCDVPCYVKECDKDYVCMRAINVDEVFAAAERILSATE